MSTPVFFHNDIIPRLKSLFAVILAHAQTLAQDLETDFAGTTAKLRPIVRTMARLMKTITTAQVYAYRARIKARMLGNPQWRAQVIAGFGGLAGLYHWERQFDTAQGRGPLDALFLGGKTLPPAQRPRPVIAVKTRQFCLPPISRICSGRERTEREWGAYAPNTASPYDAPIIVTPNELRAKPQSQMPKSAVPPDRAHEDYGQAQISKSPPTPIPP